MKNPPFDKNDPASLAKWMRESEFKMRPRARPSAWAMEDEQAAVKELADAQREARARDMREQASKLKAAPKPRPATQQMVTCPNCGVTFTPGQPAAPAPKPAYESGRAYPAPPAG